jgi:hypothetical protein
MVLVHRIKQFPNIKKLIIYIILQSLPCTNIFIIEQLIRFKLVITKMWFNYE